MFFVFFFSYEMGRRGKSVAKPAAPQRLPPKGQTGKPLRTPHHLVDLHGQSDTYGVEDIVARRIAKTGISEKQSHVHWKGYPVSARTWEHSEHLSGCEQFISRFNEERERQEHEYEQQRKKKKLDAEQSAATEGAESLSQAALTTPNSSSRRTSTVWLAFRDAPQPGFAQCTLQRKDGKPCNTIIKHCGGTSNLRSNLIAQHKEWDTHKRTQFDAKCTFKDVTCSIPFGSVVFLVWRAIFGLCLLTGCLQQWSRLKLVQRKCMGP